MYDTTDKSKVFFLYKFNKDKNEYELVKKFDTKEDFIDFVADRFIVRHGFYRSYPVRFDYNSLRDFDLTGKDTNSEYKSHSVWIGPCSDEYYGYYSITWEHILSNKTYIVYDGLGRIVSPMNMLAEIKAAAAKYYAMYTSNSWWDKKHWSRTGAYVFRNGPVPWTACRRGGGYGRSWKTWFRNYRLDNIPEYSEFVRHKAKVEDIWDVEPFHNRTKSWKDTVKCSKQWERHMKDESSRVHRRNKRAIPVEDPWALYEEETVCEM